MLAIRLQEVVVFLSEGLQAKVFTEKTQTQLGGLSRHTWLLCLGRLKLSAAQPLSPLTASLTWEGFYSAVQKVDSKLQVGLWSFDNKTHFNTTNAPCKVLFEKNFVSRWGRWGGSTLTTAGCSLPWREIWSPWRSFGCSLIQKLSFTRALRGS